MIKSYDSGNASEFGMECTLLLSYTYLKSILIMFVEYSFHTFLFLATSFTCLL